MAVNVVTGTVTATAGGVPVPTENIHPAPGMAGAVTVVASAAVTLTAPGSGPFTLPANVPLSLMLGGTKLVASAAAGSPTVSYAYATNGA